MKINYLQVELKKKNTFKHGYDQPNRQIKFPRIREKRRVCGTLQRTLNNRTLIQKQGASSNLYRS